MSLLLNTSIPGSGPINLQDLPLGTLEVGIRDGVSIRQWKTARRPLDGNYMGIFCLDCKIPVFVPFLILAGEHIDFRRPS